MLKTCRIVYLARITDTEQFDSLLSNAIAYRLASETAYAITGSNSVAQSMYALYEQKLRDAKSMDALEGKPDRIISEEFTNIRPARLLQRNYQDRVVPGLEDLND